MNAHVLQTRQIKPEKFTRFHKRGGEWNMVLSLSRSCYEHVRYARGQTLESNLNNFCLFNQIISIDDDCGKQHHCVIILIHYNAPSQNEYDFSLKCLIQGIRLNLIRSTSPKLSTCTQNCYFVLENIFLVVFENKMFVIISKNTNTTKRIQIC